MGKWLKLVEVSCCFLSHATRAKLRPWEDQVEPGTCGSSSHSIGGLCQMGEAISVNERIRRKPVKFAHALNVYTYIHISKSSLVLFEKYCLHTHNISIGIFIFK